MNENQIKRGWISNPTGTILFDEIIDDPNILKALLGNEDLKCEGIIGFITEDDDRPGYFRAVIIVQPKGIKKEIVIKVDDISSDFVKKLKRDFKLK